MPTSTALTLKAGMHKLGSSFIILELCTEVCESLYTKYTASLRLGTGRMIMMYIVHPTRAVPSFLAICIAQASSKSPNLQVYAHAFERQGAPNDVGKQNLRKMNFVQHFPLLNPPYIRSNQTDFILLQNISRHVLCKVLIVLLVYSYTKLAPLILQSKCFSQRQAKNTTPAKEGVLVPILRQSD